MCDNCNLVKEEYYFAYYNCETGNFSVIKKNDIRNFLPARADFLYFKFKFLEC